MKMTKLQTNAALSVVNLAIRIDESRFKAASDTGLVGILKQVEALRLGIAKSAHPVEAITLDPFTEQPS